jgi:hypothetical protein
MMKMVKVNKVAFGVLLALGAMAPVLGAENEIVADGAAKTLDSHFPIATDGMLEVGNVSGSVTITGGSGSDVKLSGSLGEGSKLAIDSTAHGLQLRVESEKGGWFGNGPKHPSDLVLDVPRGVSVKLDVVSADAKVKDIDGKSIEVNNVSGNVDVRGTAHSIEIESVSGDVTLDVARAGVAERTHLQTVSGNIKASGADGRVKLETVSGTVAFVAPSVSELGAESVSGNIDAKTALAKGARIHAETMSGTLRLHLPADLSARVHAETFSGSLKSDWGTVAKAEFGPGSSLDVQGNGDGTRVDAQSFSGNVELRKQ